MLLLFLLTLAIVLGSIAAVIRLRREPPETVHARLQRRAPQSRLVALDSERFADVYARARRKRSRRILIAAYGWMAGGMASGGLMMALLFREGHPVAGLLIYLAASIGCVLLGARHARTHGRSLRALMHAELRG